MTINILDLIAYVICMIIIYFILPESAKKEMGALIGASIMIIFTIIYVILFVFIDYNVYDSIIAVIDYFKTNVKIKL